MRGIAVHGFQMQLRSNRAHQREDVRQRTISSMTNIASVLKSENARVARKEVRAETQSLKKAVAAYRSEIASLKRRAQALEQEVRRLGKGNAKAKPAVATEEKPTAYRFSAKGLASQRRSDAGLVCRPRTAVCWWPPRACPSTSGSLGRRNRVPSSSQRLRVCGPWEGRMQRLG